MYVGGQLIGVFELPTRIPVLATGDQELIVVAGVKKNGFTNDRIAYPFYDVYSKTINLVPSEIDSIKPLIKYRSNAKFPWIEDFEDQTISMEKSGSTTSIDSLKITGEISEVFEYDGSKNKFSGVVAMDTGFQIFENSTVQLFDLPRSGVDIYLEFNYKTDAELVTGIYPITGTIVNGVPVVNLFPTTEWKKAYISLKEDINNPEYAGFDFRIFFNARTNSKTTIPKIYFDNIKLIHF